MPAAAIRRRATIEIDSIYSGASMPLVNIADTGSSRSMGLLILAAGGGQMPFARSRNRRMYLVPGGRRRAASTRSAKPIRAVTDLFA